MIPDLNRLGPVLAVMVTAGIFLIADLLPPR